MTEQRSEGARVTLVECDTPFEVLSGTFVQQRFAPHTHDTYAIGTIERGASRVHFRGAMVTHGVGDVITIDPHEPHTGEPAGPDGWTYRMIYVPVALMPAHGDGTPRFARSAYHDPELAARLIETHLVLESPAPSAEKLAALRHFLRLLCERWASAAGDARGCRRTDALEGVRLHLESHHAQRVAIADVAELARMSTFHLIRQFRRAYGLPPYMFLEQVRISRAREMLQRGERISDIAYMTGFSDQSHFTRRFKRVVGVPPGQYAKCYAPRARPGGVSPRAIHAGAPPVRVGLAG